VTNLRTPFLLSLVLTGALIGLAALFFLGTTAPMPPMPIMPPAPLALTMAAPPPAFPNHEQFSAALQATRQSIETLRKTEPSVASALSVRLRFLRERIESQEKEWNQGKYDAAKKEFEPIQKDLDGVVQGKSLLVPGKPLLMGYFSDLDDSDQPYSLFIPKDYDPQTPTPLAVLLHGQGMFNPLQCNAAPIGQMIVVAPQGRGGMDYMYVGEADVLRVIDEVQKLLNIDPDRISLCGASMGGAGSWHLAAMYPDRFAGIMPLCGNTDINVWSKLWLWKTPENSPIAAVRHFLREDTCAVTYAENLLNVPIIALQGEADPIVNQLHAKSMDAALKASGHEKFKIHILPYVTHSISANYDLGLKTFKREPKPLHIRYKTAWLKNPGAYWLKIDGMQQQLKHASVDALIDAKGLKIAITTTNVSAIQLVEEKLPFPLRSAFVVLDTQVFLPGEVTSFERSAGGKWQASAPKAVAPAALKKSASSEGPVEHAFMSRFVLVSGEGPQADGARQAAKDIVDQWQTRFAVPCRSKNASQITDQDIADSNLILIGTPKDNPLLARIADRLPLKYLDDGKLKLGDAEYSGANLGAMICFPNPLNPARYVVAISGTTPRAYDDIHVRFGNWFDWVPYDYRKHFDFMIFDDKTSGRHPESFLVWGFFDKLWKLTPALTFSAVPAWREKLLPRVFAGKPDPESQTRFLDQLAPKSSSVTKEYLERNRTLDGTPLQLLGKEYKRGLTARFPCSLTFECKGFARLKVTAGVGWDGSTEPSDDRKQSEKVTVQISADGKQIFEAKEVTYKSKPTEIDVDLKGASTVTLSASGGLSWLNGSFVWADGRLEKSAEVKLPEANKAP